MLDSPVLFITFNRPEPTQKVFDAIRTARPSKLYIASDGPRIGNQSDRRKIQEVHEIVGKVDWPCEVNTLYRTDNLGCKIAVSSAIDWFFEQEEAGIILEDDCLPHPDFFVFCSELLVRYKDEEKVFSITGTNIQSGIKRGSASYYFSKYAHVWGWASWRRAWQHYQLDMSYWPKWKNSKEWRQRNFSLLEKKCWNKVFDKVYRNEVDTWDYQWTACNFYKGGLVATPHVNLIRNIGFGEDATHTKGQDTSVNIKLDPIGTLNHPNQVYWDREADIYEFRTTFGKKYTGWKNLWRVVAKLILE
jgi:hypothetical protein